MQKNSNKMTKQSRKTAKRKGSKCTERMPLLFILGILPLIVGCRKGRLPMTDVPWMPNAAEHYDFFLYWKQAALLSAAVWMLILLADRFVIRRIRPKLSKVHFVLAAYLLLAVLSALFSVDRRISFQGMADQYESVWVLLAYGLTAFYAGEVTETEEDVRILLKALTIGAFVQGLLGFSQLVGADFWNSALGKWILTPGQSSEARQQMTFVFAEGANRVYMALYNPNYAGVYTVLVLPVIAAYFAAAKKRWEKILAGVTILLLTADLAGSGSKTGMAVLALLLFAAVIVFSCQYLRNKHRFWWSVPVLTAAVIAAAAAAYDAGTGHALQKAIQKSLRKVENYKMEDVIPKQDSVELHYRGHVLELSMEEGVLRIWENEEQLPVYLLEKEQCLVLDGEDFYDVAFGAQSKDGQDTIIIYCNRTAFTFVKEAEQPYTYVTVFGKPDEIKTADSLFFEGREKAFSNRGYIWSRTMPLLKNRLLLGSGPDTFLAVFPQDDYLMRANTNAQLMQQILLKPHSMYLQTAVQTGVLSLICLLLFWGSVLYRLMRILRDNGTAQETVLSDTKRQQRIYAAGFVLSITGYLLMGCLNDSSLAAAPVFWGLLGAALAVTEQSEIG